MAMIGGSIMGKYIVVGNFKRARKDHDGETQECNTYEEALKVKEEWQKSNKYREVVIDKWQ